MKNQSSRKFSLIVLVPSIFTCSLIIFTQLHSQYAFGIEEKFLVFQSGIISTESKDYAISNNFELRIIQDGKIMRLSGITTTGEVYYLYQKMEDRESIVNGKISVNGVFIPIKYKDQIFEQEVLITPKTELIFSTKLPHHTYANYPFPISVKVFDAKKNPEAKFEHEEGVLENVFVNVTITNQNDKLVTLLSGKTDSSGVYRGSYVVRYNIDHPGKYNVKVSVGDEEKSIDKFYTTFFRGSIQDYFGDNNP